MEKGYDFNHEADFGVADFETTPIAGEKQKFVIGGVFNGKDFYYSEKISELVDFMIKSEKKIYYFHNLNYDFRFMLDYLRKNFRMSIFPYSAGVLQVKIYGGKNKLVELRDSYAIFRRDLFSLTRDFNTKFFKGKFDFSTEYEISPELIEYLKNDCLSLYEALCNFMRILNLKKLNLTISCISLSQFSSSTPFYEICKQPGKYRNLFRRALYGGRVEVFRKKIEHGFMFDFNSLYPFVMWKYPYPVGIIREFPPDDLPRFYIAKIRDIRIPPIDIPPVPIRDGYRNIYPVGNVDEGIYTSVDLDLFRKYDVEFEIEKIWGWNSYSHLFKDFIAGYARLKEQAGRKGNKSEYQAYKLILNSLWGKLSQGREKYVVESGKYAEIEEKYRDRANFLRIESTEIDDVYVVYFQNWGKTTAHLSAFICSYARRELYEKMIEIQNAGGEIYYCDTDSIVTDIMISHDPHRMGELSLEYEIEEGYFALPKLYALRIKDGKVLIKSKGIGLRDSEKNGKIVESLSYSDIRDFVHGKKKITGISYRVPKLKSYLKGDPLRCSILKRTITAEDKRKFDGYVSVPYRVMKNVILES